MVNLRRRALFGGGGGDFPIMTSDTNPKILAIFYNAGFCASPDVMYKSEAEAMTDDDFGSGADALFYDAKTQEAFDAFQYFTNIVVVGGSCFQNARFTSIILPKSLTTINGSWAFGGQDITEIIIPSSVTQLSYYGFFQSTYSTAANFTIIFESTTPPRLGQYSQDFTCFGGKTAMQKLTIYVPDGYVDTYKTAWANVSPSPNTTTEEWLAIIKPISEYQQN